MNMDEFSRERTLHKFSASSKGASLVMRDTASSRARKAQICSRLGCSSRLNSIKGTQTACLDKSRYPRPSFRSLNSGKEVAGSSSRSNITVNSQRKTFPGRQKELVSQLESDSSETSSVQDERDISEVNPPPGKIQRGPFIESGSVEFGEAVPTKMGSSSTASSSSRPAEDDSHSLSFNKALTPSGSSVSMESKSISHAPHTNISRNGFRSVRCNSASNAVPSNGSILHPTSSRKKELVKKLNSEGEASSSARGKNSSRLSLEGRNSSADQGLSISESRRARCRASNRDNGVTTVRTRRSISCAQSRYEGNLSNRAPNRSPMRTLVTHQSPTSVEMHPSLQCEFSVETASSLATAYGRPGSSSESSQCVIPSSLAEIGIRRSLTSQDHFQQDSMDGIAEVLLALERIEQDEELTYEQLIALETNLFLSGMNFYDQHRDMRLDIDNMSYEELLALEERMGTVSTALTEDALANCLKRGLYHPSASSTGQKDDVKCSICQEEYVVGDEVGRLACEHMYHVSCVHQWLRLKNWCPICKGSAEASPLSSPSSLTS